MKLKFTLDKSSVAQLEQNVLAALEGSVQAGARALDKIVDQVGIMCDSYVPRHTGSLAAAQYKKAAKLVGQVVTAEIGYGGPADRVNPRTGQLVSSYMFYVHEDLAKHHPVGQAKFLEVPVRMSEHIMMSLLHWEISAALAIKRVR